MKTMVGVSIYCKQDMIRWILEGIRDNFDPAQTEVVFFFETLGDNSRKNFIEEAPELLRGFAWGYDWSEQHVLEHGAHRWLINKFMISHSDVLVIPHDDNRFNQPIEEDIRHLISEYGDKLGWVGSRDAYGFSYDNMISSPFSTSDVARNKGLIGEFYPRMMMNTGPNIYTRKLIEKIGLPDPDMAWYWWDDYALRAHQAGLINGLLAMDCEHRKFGALQHNEVLYSPECVAKGLAQLNDRWRPVFGRNVIF